jgi:hypothetical protein
VTKVARSSTFFGEGKNPASRTVFYSAVKTETGYHEERLAQLLQLLRPAPEDWVRRAQELPLGVPLTDADVAQLAQLLEREAGFRARFDADPIAAAETAGMQALAAQLKREMRELVSLAERIASDDTYRRELDEDPQAVLVAAGIPRETTEPVLRAFALPDEVLDKVPDFVAHRDEKLSLKARLVMMLVGTSALNEAVRAVT